MADELVLEEVKNMRRELATIRTLVAQVIGYIREAESEIPEKMRRFMNYMHDVHDIKYMYEELGHPLPQYILRELERLDDRYRQLLAEHNIEGGAFSKVRREMATDTENRWDHTRQLAPPTHTKLVEEKDNETRKREFLESRLNEAGAGIEGGAASVPSELGSEGGQSRDGQGDGQREEDPNVRGTGPEGSDGIPESLPQG